MTDPQKNKINDDELRSLGFSEEAIKEAQEREKRGLLDIKPSVDLVERVKKQVGTQLPQGPTFKEFCALSVLPNFMKYAGILSAVSAAVNSANDKHYWVLQATVGLGLYVVGSAVPDLVGMFNAESCSNYVGSLHNKVDKLLEEKQGETK
ncbi:hypothetical protein HY484_01990 [Candidatus Woesearchaeota archaeon]|nr:hypothetical protein [Candidatus Woesearchaeota archaeon]